MKRSWSNVSSNSSPGFVYFNQTSNQPAETSDFLPFSGSPTPNAKQNSPSHYSSPKFHNNSGHFNARNSSSGASYGDDPNPKRLSGEKRKSQSPHYNPNNRYSGGNHGNQFGYSNQNNRYSGGFYGNQSPHHNTNNSYLGGNYRNPSPLSNPNNSFSGGNYRNPSSFGNSNNRYSGGNFRIQSKYSLDRSHNSDFNNSRGRNGKQKHKWNFRNNPKNSNGKGDMSVYYDPTCIKNPWSELEQELKTKRAEEALRNSLKDKDNVKNIVEDEDSDSMDTSECDDSASTITEEENT